MARPNSQLTVRGTDGDDLHIYVPIGATLSATLFDGRRGNDTLDLSTYASVGVSIMLEGGFAKSKSALWETPFIGAFSTAQITAPKVAGSIVNVENIIGTSGDDRLILWTPISPTKFADGGPGDDMINPRGGIGIGGTGSDWLISYLSGNTLVGGTFVGGTIVRDGTPDAFYLNSAPTILDFEVNVDRLIFEIDASIIPAFEAALWASDGNGGTSLSINGSLEVTLAGVAPAQAEMIKLGFAVGPLNSVLQGSSGDDMLYSSSSSERIILSANSGNDLVIDFTLNDVLVFEGGLVPTWSDTTINGQAALLGTFGSSSVTLEGYTIAAVPNLIMEPNFAADAYAAAGLGPWSVPNDADYYP